MLYGAEIFLELFFFFLCIFSCVSIQHESYKTRLCFPFLEDRIGIVGFLPVHLAFLQGTRIAVNVISDVFSIRRCSIAGSLLLGEG